MTDETQVETPLEDAPLLSAETQPADSSTAEKAETPVEHADDASQPRDEDGKFLSKNAQRRIDELTREKYERAREAEYWRQQAMQQSQPAPKAPEPTKLPTLEEHGYDEAKYQAALLSYVEQKAESVVEKRLSAVEAQRREQARLTTFAERQQAFAKTTPDFEARVFQDPTLPITEGMRDVILDSDSGPELAYYLATNRDTAEAIARLPPHLAALEMGRIEGRLSAQKEAVRRPVVSKAPPPPPTLEATDSAGVAKTTDATGDKLSDDEWVRAERKRLSKKATR